MVVLTGTATRRAVRAAPPLVEPARKVGGAVTDYIERMLEIQAEHERAEREDPLHQAALARSVAALGDDEELMWRMGVHEWDIQGDVSRSLRAEVVRQSREHVTHLVDAMNDRVITPAATDGSSS